MSDLDDKLTARARQVLALADEEARRLGHAAVGPEHLLLGLLREREGVAARALSNLGVNLSKARRGVEATVGWGQAPESSSEQRTGWWRRVMDALPAPVLRDQQQTADRLDLTPQARRVLQRARAEMQRLDHQFVGTEHLLLALVQEENGGAAAVLRHLNVSGEAVRAELQTVIEKAIREGGRI